MVKGGSADERRPMLLIGLTWEEIAGMVKTKLPIVFDAAQCGFDGTVLIWAGRDDQDLLDTFKANMEDRAEIHVVRLDEAGNA